jgi:hypothetical protein
MVMNVRGRLQGLDEGCREEEEEEDEPSPHASCLSLSSDCRLLLNPDPDREVAAPEKKVEKGLVEEEGGESVAAGGSTKEQPEKTIWPAGELERGSDVDCGLRSTRRTAPRPVSGEPSLASLENARMRRTPSPRRPRLLWVRCRARPPRSPWPKLPWTGLC